MMMMLAINVLLKLSKITGRDGINFSDVLWVQSNLCILRALALIHEFLAITFHMTWLMIAVTHKLL